MKYHCFLRWSLPAMAVLCSALFVTSSFAAEPDSSEPAAEEQHEGVPLKPAEILHIGKFTVTNSMLVPWIVAAGIIVLAQTAMRNVRPVPSGRKNFWEWMVESLHNFLESVIGAELVKKTFWFFA